MRLVLAAAVAATMLVRPSDAADRPGEPVYVNADAVLSAREIHTFEVDGETVNVLLGEFSLAVGKRVVSGRDAVVWVRERQQDGRTLRDIEVYVEGNARAVEPDGTTLTDPQSLRVLVHHHGQLRARVAAHSDRKLDSFPLYRRALQARKQAAEQPVVAVAPPQLVRRPAPSPPPPVRTRPARRAASGPAPRPVAPPHQPVSFRADEVSSQELPDPADPKVKRRITIAKGKVYFSQGHPDSDLFVEMRADAAVLYTLPGPAAVPTAERIQGAYLEGDVVMRRGERMIRGEQLFYDFTTGRAIILEPVFRTIQEQRNIPVYIRAKEGRQLAAYEDEKTGRRERGYRWYFREARVTTSDFFTPTYHIAARRVYLEDTTPYDDKGVALDEQSWRSKLTNTTFNVRGVPLLWTPQVVGDFREGHTALRKVQVGRHGRFGFGGETEWFLFRLLGVPRPEGFKGRAELSLYERGLLGGARVSYRREKYSGYALAYGMIDSEAEDEFGTDREDVPADKRRGRVLLRHKHFLPRDWQLQLELSYLSDRNFLEAFFPGEFWTEKPQDTLVYVKKQKDNWAVTGLAQWRINDFLTQTEAYPEVAAYLIGEPLWRDRLTLHSEGRLGVVRFRPDDLVDGGSPSTFRADTRHEIDLPFNLGPVKVLPYVAGRLSYWQHDLRDSDEVRSWGQLGVNALLHIWRIYDNVHSRLWDLHRIKHVITPHGSLYVIGTTVDPDELYPFTEGIEREINDGVGGTIGVRQLWQTKRGPKGQQHTVDWLRVDVAASLFSNKDEHLPADGRYFTYRPEYSLARNAINADVAWHISDSTTFLADANYDIDSGRFGRANAGVVFVRDPRLRYYLGIRHIDPLDSTVGTVGFTYKINRKYSVSLFEQYDFSMDDGKNLVTSATVLRKFPRLYLGFTVVYDRTQDDISLVVTLWPEGVPEATIGGRRLSLMMAAPDED